MFLISQNLSSVKLLSGSHDHLLFSSRVSQLSLRTLNPKPFPFPSTTIRMGGGPRTYPGGVSKWQWKRMQAKKAKHLLKARLCRERQIYEMRKRAELRAAVSELEKPWEVVERAPKLFSVSADEQLKALADRFQKPGGFDMWSDRDGPQLFHPEHGLPSARFFPKGVVHSIKPYGTVLTEDPTSSSSSRRSRRFRSNSERGDELLDTKDTVARIHESGDVGISGGGGEDPYASGANKKVHPPPRSRRSSRNRGNRRNDHSPERQLTASEGRGRSEIPRGRYGIRISGGGRQHLSRKSSTVSPSREEEAYEMSLRPDGCYEFRTTTHVEIHSMP